MQTLSLSNMLICRSVRYIIPLRNLCRFSVCALQKNVFHKKTSHLPSMQGNSQANTRHFSCSMAMSKETNSEVNTLTDSILDDPDMKKFLKEIAVDFGNQENIAESSDSGSESDLDSSDSDSDIDSSRTKYEEVTPDIIDQEMARYDYDEYEDIEDDSDEEIDPTDIDADGVIFEDEPLPISRERGITGVFDVEELVTVLREDNARDLCVIQVPKEHKYVDHLVLVTGRSSRHIKAMAQFVQKLYKAKRHKKDKGSVKIEGLDNSSDWLAIDLGNIALHLFLQHTREMYDIETLWTVGAEFDEKSKEQGDPFAISADDFTLRKQTEPVVLGDTEQILVYPGEGEDDHVKQRYSNEGMDSLVGWHADVINSEEKDPKK